MIDIVKAVQQADPSLGTYVVVLRADARALDGPDRLTPEAQAWIDANAPGGRLARVGHRVRGVAPTASGSGVVRRSRLTGRPARTRRAVEDARRTHRTPGTYAGASPPLRPCAAASRSP